MNIRSHIEKAIAEIGFSEFGYVGIDRLVYHSEVRAICEANTCRNYNTSWACPPAVGTVEECRARVAKYGRMILFSRAYQLEDSFDLEGMMAGMQDFKDLTDRFQEKLDAITSDYRLLSNEGCGRCASCAYPDAPCRFPKRLHHSLEGYGFIVSELAKEAHIRYSNGSNTVTYFGALLFHEEE